MEGRGGGHSIWWALYSTRQGRSPCCSASITAIKSRTFPRDVSLGQFQRYRKLQLHLKILKKCYNIGLPQFGFETANLAGLQTVSTGSGVAVAAGACPGEEVLQGE